MKLWSSMKSNVFCSAMYVFYRSLNIQFESLYLCWWKICSSSIIYTINPYNKPCAHDSLRTFMLLNVLAIHFFYVPVAKWSRVFGGFGISAYFHTSLFKTCNEGLNCIMVTVNEI